ncbi:MAG: carbamoyl-phosphate synthase large subunit, partial [Rickettsiales bacterium]|nr:carbamoyl-phosphate synthase large subunit [Rickettsiales bacterium]
SFEPTIDYVVTKIPRFTFEKFANEDQILTSAMKSVGETMAIGGNFCESLQKALRSLETGLAGFNDKPDEDLEAKLALRTPKRIMLIAQAFREGYSLERVQKLTEWDNWFLEQIQKIIQLEIAIKEKTIDVNDAETLLYLKKHGFSDKRISELLNTEEEKIRNIRYKNNIHPVFKRVDTCAAEFEAQTPYMYSSYRDSFFSPNPNHLPEGEGRACEGKPSDKNKVIILGSGPNRIGQGIEFDYTCVHACYAMQERGIESIMVNCNPETVSTDYDTSDRLYFEPITTEDVLEIIRLERKSGNLLGVNVQFGGQTPLKLAKSLELAGVPLLGTSNRTIELAEDRKLFKDFIESHKLIQPKNDINNPGEDLYSKANSVGYPLVVRPSFVLGGRAMAIIYNEAELKNYIANNPAVYETGPILLDSFLRNATEVDVDAISDGENVFIAGVMEHIEEAGIHSGDSACSIPPYSLSRKIIDELKKQTRIIAKGLNVRGLINVQFAIKDDVIYILEVNPRASRTVPFVAKATGVKVAKIASLVMIGEKLSNLLDVQKTEENFFNLGYYSVKEVVFPFNKFSSADSILGPEMKSTGEAMGLDKTFPLAFAKAHMGCNSPLPIVGGVFISVKDYDKEAVLPIAKNLLELGYKIYATKGTAKFLSENNIPVQPVNKVAEGSPHTVDLLSEGKINLVINTTEGEKSIRDSFSIRRTAIMKKIPHTLTINGARALVNALKEIREIKDFEVRSIQSL